MTRRIADPVRREGIDAAHVNDVASVASTLVHGLRELGLDAELVAEDPRTIGLVSRFGIASIPARVAMIRRQRRSVHRLDPGIVHVHNARHAPIFRIRDRPLVVHCHGTDVRGVDPSSMLGRYLRRCLSGADHVFFSTWDLRSSVDALGGGEFLPNPVDTELFVPAPPGHQRRDVLVGVRLTAEKGVDTVLALVEAISAIRAQTTFTILASGTHIDHARALAGAEVEVVEPLDRAGLASLMRGHRTAIGQFVSGSPGMYELECLASGVPVAMDFRMQDAYAEQPPLPRLGADQVADARDWLVELLDDDAHLEATAAASREWVSSQHSVRVAAGRVAEIYAGLGIVPSAGAGSSSPVGG